MSASLPARLVTLVLLLTGAPVLAGGKHVRLLIPILTGAELDQVRQLAPKAAIVTINGGTFLEVGAFTDARVAHRLGRSIQKRLAIPFDLAYDPDHPQVDLALGDEPLKPSQTIAQQASAVQQLAVAPAPQPAATDPIWAPISVGLSDVLAEAAPLQALAQTEVSTDPASGQPEADGTAGSGQLTAVVEEVSGLSQAQIPPQPAATQPAAIDPALTLIAAAVDAGAELDSPNLHHEVVLAVAGNTPEPKPEEAVTRDVAVAEPTSQQELEATEQQPVHRKALMPAVHAAPEVDNSLAALPAPVAITQPQARLVVELPFAKPIATPKAHRPHPWLKPVQIAAVKVEPPLSRSGVAVNPHLNYLYVKIQKPADVARLELITPVMELNPVGTTMVARVGVYTQSRTGRQLMEAQIAELRQHKVHVLIAHGGSLPTSIS
jgi:hypothetical protein